MKKSRTFDEIVRLHDDSAHAAPALVRTADEQVDLWYDQYADKLHRRLRGWFDGAIVQHVDDAVHETFLRLHIELLDGKSIDHPYAWACRVAHNLMLDEIEHAQRTRPICPDADESVRDPRPTPHQVVWRKHRRQALSGAWSKLSQIERTCFDLRAQGMTLAEVGEVVNLRHQRVGEIVTRAIKRLRKVVGE